MAKTVLDVKLVVACIDKINKRYNEAIENAEQNLLRAITGFQDKLFEIQRLQSLNLPCLIDEDGQSKLSDYDIVTAATTKDYYCGMVDIIVDVEDLRLLRKEFGEFKLDDDRKEIADAKKNTVKIPVKFVKPLIAIRVHTIREIPPDAKCTIVKTTRTVTDTSLVCSTDRNEDVEVCVDDDE